MKKLRISPSRLKIFLECQWKYYCRYILKLEDPGNDKARLGTIIHTVYECITNQKRLYRKKYVLFSMATKSLHPVVLRFFNKLFKKAELKINPKIDLKELGEKLLLNGLLFGFDIQQKILDTEYEFEVDLGDNVSTYGFIDKIQENDSETIEIVDYKSGVPYSWEDCNTDFQVYIYLHALREKYPNYKNYLFTFQFLKNHKSITVPKSKVEIDNFIKYVKSQAGKMLEINAKNSKPNRSFRCAWCSYRLPRDNYAGCPAHYK